MRGIDVETGHAFVSFETYYMRLSSITVDKKIRLLNHLLVGDEVEYLYKGKSYCDDCYRAVKKAATGASS
jgi:hypothetical protein